MKYELKAEMQWLDEIRHYVVFSLFSFLFSQNWQDA